MIGLARRAALQALLGAPLAAPVMARAVAGEALKAARMTISNDSGWAVDTDSVFNPREPTPVRQAIIDRLKEARDSLMRDEQDRKMVRRGGLDPDLRAFRSCSETYLALKQRERSKESRALHEKINEVLGW